MAEIQVVAETVLNLMDQIAETKDDGPVLSLVAEMRGCLDGAAPSMILKQVVNELVAKYATPPEAMIDEKGESYFTIGDFMAKLQVKMGRTYGWRVDYVTASTAAGCTETRTEHIQRWQQTKRVPVWAYNQIDIMSFDTRKGKGGPQWTTQDTNHLISLYLANPCTPNADLAEMCSQHFGRPITEDSIKGALDRLRKKGHLDKYRPAKPGKIRP